MQLPMTGYGRAGFVASLLTLIVGFNRVRGGRDYCIDQQHFLPASLGCAQIPAHLFPAAGDCTGPFGPACALSCGICDVLPFPQPDCTPEEIYDNKMKIATVLQELEVCKECRPPPLNESHIAPSYVTKPPTLLTMFPTYGYTSADPLDPCSFPGVTCDRCGEAIHVLLGAPVDGPIPATGVVTPNIFALNRVQSLLLQRTATPANTSDLPLEGWANFTELTSVFLMRAGIGGDVPPVGYLPLLKYLRFGFNGFVRGFNNMLGAPIMWGVQFDESAENFPLVENSQLSDRVCNSQDLGLLSLTYTGYFGPFPTCVSTMRKLQYLTLPGNAFSGPLAPFLQSPELIYVYVEYNQFTGTLPSSLSSCHSLDQLHVGHNQLTGTLPDMNLSSLTLLSLEDNLFTSAGILGGHPDGMVVELRGNRFTEIPASWWSLPRVRSLDLEENEISSWPAAGIYPAGTLGEENLLPAFCIPYEAPPLEWPSLRTLRLSRNPINVDARNFLASLSNLPRLSELTVVDCGLYGELPNEGGRLTPFIEEACVRTDYGFRSLTTLNLRGNAITALRAGPWEALTQGDWGDNNLSHIDSGWMLGDTGPQLVDFTGNIGLRYSKTRPPPTSGRCMEGEPGEVFADPNAFGDAVAGGFHCTELCPLGNFGRRRLVDPAIATTSLCKCLPGYYGTGDACTVCPVDHWCAGGEPDPTPCPPNTSSSGSEGQSSQQSCACNYPLYRYFLSGSDWECRPCLDNQRRSLSGSSPCEACPVGTFGSQCEDCPPGTKAAGGVGSGCVDCDPGTFSNQLGATACEDCGITSYQPSRGATSCLNCTAGMQAWRWFEGRFIDHSKANSSEDCGCQRGSRPVGDACETCGEGLYCPGGQKDITIRLEEGFTSAMPISVYRCWGNAKRCPGNLRPGEACASGRTDIGCGRCETGKGPRPDGTCEDCTASTEILIPIGAILMVLIIAFAYYIVDRNIAHATKNQTALSVSISVSLLLQVIHHVGLVSMLSLEWQEPLATLFEIARLLTLDLELLQFQCVSDMKPFQLFIGKLLVLVYIFVCILLLHVGNVILFHHGKFRKHRVTLFASSAAFASFFFIAIVATTSAPLQCQEHPNHKLTTRIYQSVICWESAEHTRMAVLSICAVLLPIVYLAFVAHVAYEYPRRLANVDMEFLRTYSCLFNRFNTNAYWFIPISLLRSLLLGLAPVIVLVEGTLLVMFIVHFTAVATVCRLVPWRVDTANLFDTICGGAVLLLLCFSVFFVPDTGDKRTTMAVLASVIILGSLLMILLAICLNLFYRCKKAKKTYSYFLCHHKAGAGAFVRLLKLVLVDASGGGRQIFVDSDNLENLDRLFMHVQQETETVVAVWSRELLSRPWCAGELTTARLSKVPVRILRMLDWAAPTPLMIEKYSACVEVHAIAEHGMSDSLIGETFKWFGGQPSIQMPERLNHDVLHTLVKMLTSKETGTVPLAEDRLPEDPSIGILCDHMSTEAASTALVLERMMVSCLIDMGSSMVPGWISNPVHVPHTLVSMVVVCTTGCFSCEWVVSILQVCARRQLIPFPVVGEDGFRFLTKEGLEELRAKPDAEGIRRGSVVDYISVMFKEIAPSFLAQHASERNLRTTAQTLCTRLVKAEEIGGRGSSTKSLKDSDEGQDPANGTQTEENAGIQKLNELHSSNVATRSMQAGTKSAQVAPSAASAQSTSAKSKGQSVSIQAPVAPARPPDADIDPSGALTTLSADYEDDFELEDWEC